MPGALSRCIRVSLFFLFKAGPCFGAGQFLEAPRTDGFLSVEAKDGGQ